MPQRWCACIAESTNHWPGAHGGRRWTAQVTVPFMDIEPFPTSPVNRTTGRSTMAVWRTRPGRGEANKQLLHRPGVNTIAPNQSRHIPQWHTETARQSTGWIGESVEFNPKHPNQGSGFPCFCFHTNLPHAGVNINAWASAGWSASGWLRSFSVDRPMTGPVKSGNLPTHVPCG